MTTKIRKDTFTGSGNVFNGTLADAMRGLAQNIAAKAASAVADFTADNSGGTPGEVIANVAAFTPSTKTGSNAVAKAEAETAAGGVVNALSELIAKLNAIQAVVPAFDELVDSTGGAAADGTIAVIDVSATGATASLATAAGMNTLYSTLRSRVAQLVHYTNKMCEATGQAKLTNGITADYDASFSTTFAAVSTDTGTAVDGTDSEDNACVLKTEWDAAQVSLANAIASIAAKLEAIVDDANATTVCNVVAA